MKKASCMILALLLCLSACSTVSPSPSGEESTGDILGTTSASSTTATDSTTQETPSSLSTTTTTTKDRAPTTHPPTLCKGYPRPRRGKSFSFDTMEEYRDFLLKMHTYDDFRALCRTETSRYTIAEPNDISMLLQDKCFPIPIIKGAPQIDAITFYVIGITQFVVAGRIVIDVYHGESSIAKMQKNPGEPCPSHAGHAPSDMYDSGSFVTDKGLHVEKCITIWPESGNYGNIIYGIPFRDKYWIRIEPKELERNIQDVRFIEKFVDHLTFETVEIP